jgi:hypothetical protein
VRANEKSQRRHRLVELAPSAKQLEAQAEILAQTRSVQMTRRLMEGIETAKKKAAD